MVFKTVVVDIAHAGDVVSETTLRDGFERVVWGAIVTDDEP